MAEINAMINALLADRSYFTTQQLHSMIEFVNELDEETLYQFENSDDRTIMFAYEQLVFPDRRNRTDDHEMQLLNRPANTAIQNNRAFFERYNTSVPYGRGYGGNVYEDATKIKYDYAGKILSAVGGLATMGGGIAAAVAATTTSTVRAVLTATGGAASLAGGALVVLRNSLADSQMASNKRFIETVKKIVKARNKVNKFFEDTNNKVVKDPAKAATQLQAGLSSHPSRFTRGPNNTTVYQNLSAVEKLLQEDFASQHYNIKSKLIIRNGDPWFIRLETLRSEPRELSQMDLEVLQNVASRL
ncbi:hypothetical protein [Franconibacter helveticus]|uniref:hypothetical protein n=1 Tax=Franconibacter helveticus TaxID=357240 RepID=UPI002909D17D|nr:hypothetical protein [Franconibacter helveticus]MDU6923755.1 hypothetical protein [Franconibacter helveticus]